MEFAISKNPLKTKRDLQQAFLQLTEPLKQYYSPGHAELRLGATAAAYPQKTAFFEGFSRVFWGLTPFLAGGGETELEQLYLEGLRNGTNPKHPEYWGKVPSYDQRIVEMAALGLALALAPDRFWNPLQENEKENLYRWLNVLDHSHPYANNWLFFRVLVDLGLQTVGMQFDRELLAKTLETLDSFYRGDGWYSDGNKEQYDYYISFAMHFYGLIYGKLTGEEKYLRRAEIFAEDFIYWFSSEGDALPFGRSLTYKFAQSAFWSAYVFAGGKGDLGVIKGILLRNLRWWFRQPIFDRDGVLAIGYAYPNLIMSEGYNALGSQYWALKSLLVLALPEEHPFWQAEEKPMPLFEGRSVQIHPKMILSRTEKGRHVVALTSGQYADFLPSHVEAKYSKFAYSNVFGFSVSKSNLSVREGAFDSMLALSEDGKDYRVRQKCEKILVTEQAVWSVWKPWDDVQITTALIPLGSYHVRVHKINSARTLVTAECGFSTARSEETPALRELKGSGAVCALYPWGCSGIADLSGQRSAELMENE